MQEKTGLNPDFSKLELGEKTGEIGPPLIFPRQEL